MQADQFRVNASSISRIFAVFLMHALFCILSTNFIYTVLKNKGVSKEVYEHAERGNERLTNIDGKINSFLLCLLTMR